LPKTWIFDLDGLLVPHNGHLRGEDVLLPGVKAFWERITLADVVIVLTARAPACAPAIQSFFTREGLRVDHVVTGCTVGERVLFNDTKPSGLATAFAVNVARDAGLTGVTVQLDPQL